MVDPCSRISAADRSFPSRSRRPAFFL